MGLFMLGDFTLRSGAKSAWKLECDALTPDDWASLAKMAVEILPPFGRVEGVPRGGIPFADALRKYVDSDVGGPLLIAEDVCTTGGSMERFVAGLRSADPFWNPNRAVIGVCVFARQLMWPSWVYPLFAFNPKRVIASATDKARENWEQWKDFKPGDLK